MMQCGDAVTENQGREVSEMNLNDEKSDGKQYNECTENQREELDRVYWIQARLFLQFSTLFTMTLGQSHLFPHPFEVPNQTNQPNRFTTMPGSNPAINAEPSYRECQVIESDL